VVNCDWRVGSLGVVELYEPFVLLKDVDETRDFLLDLLTPEERERLASRWRAMKLLAQGMRPTEVHRKTGISRTTIARARRVVRHGSGVIEKLVQRSLNRDSDSSISSSE
jgi:uncharacterized protein YerC